MAHANLKHFENYKLNVLNEKTLEEKNLIAEPPRYLQFQEPIDLYPYAHLNKSQRQSFYSFSPSEDCLTLTNRFERDLIGFQEPRGKSTSLFMATPSKVVGYVTLQIQSHYEYIADISPQQCAQVGIKKTDKVAVMRCLAVDQNFEGKDIGGTLFSTTLDSLLPFPSIKYLVWEALPSSKSYYQNKLGFQPFQLGKYNFAIDITQLP